MSDRSTYQLLLVTGVAGAGRATAINALEDLGFEAIDNMPVSLLPRLLKGDALEKPLALGIDSRTRGFDAHTLLDQLPDNPDLTVGLLFLDCSEETLLRRFNETRRRHPLAPKDTPSAGIKQEKAMLAGLKAKADILIDTSEMSPHELKAELRNLFGETGEDSLSISVQSFSYKRGTPRGIDMIFDCRFLQNPHWIAELRGLTGLDEAVRKYVESDPLYLPFVDQVENMLDLLLPAYREEGKAHFTIGFGCSGGRHRSVTLVENLSQALAQKEWQVSKRHRELDRADE